MVEKLNLEGLVVEPKKKVSLWTKVFNKNKLKKTNKIAVLTLHENRNAEGLIIEPKDGMFSIANKTYHEDIDCVYQLKIGNERFPLCILPMWGLIPIGTKQWYDLPIEERLARLQQHTVRAISHAELVRSGEVDGKKINPKVVIGFIIIAIIGFALWKQYGGG